MDLEQCQDAAPAALMLKPADADALARAFLRLSATADVAFGHWGRAGRPFKGRAFCTWMAIVRRRDRARYRLRALGREACESALNKALVSASDRDHMARIDMEQVELFAARRVP